MVRGGQGVPVPRLSFSGLVEDVDMNVYTVKAWTVGKFIPRGVAWEPDNFSGWILAEDCVFEDRDVVFKPFSEAKLPKLMGDLSQFGFWGFRRDGYIVVFNGDKVDCVGSKAGCHG